MSNTNTNMVLFLLFLVTLLTIPTPSISDTNSFIFGGCSRFKYSPGSIYENSVNSILTSLVNSAAFSNYNNFTVSGSAESETVYGLFQCRGDINNDQCSRCVARAVSQLGTLCFATYGGALQLEGCFVKYDNLTFFGVQDKTEVVKKCGTSIGLTSDAFSRRDAVLAYLQSSDGGYKNFRTTSAGDFQSVAQCTEDLSSSKCQDCVSEAIQRLKTECGDSTWGDMYLAKCYVRYSEGGDHSRRSNGMWFLLYLTLLSCYVFEIRHG